MITTNGTIPEWAIEKYKEKVTNIFSGDPEFKSEVDAVVFCAVHEAAGAPHHTPSLGVDLRKNGSGYKMLLNCRSQGCDFYKILKELGITEDDLYIREEDQEETKGCTLEQYARIKGLDVAYLAGDEVGLQDDEYAGKPAVRIPYYDEDGKYLPNHDRWRILQKKQGKDHPIRGQSKKSGGQLTLYGRHWLPEAREAGYVLVVEGESDCHTAWQAGYKAVGIPGVQNFNPEWARFFEGIPEIFVIVEDRAGEVLWSKMYARESLRDRLHKVVL